jgi:hypothetical protein
LKLILEIKPEKGQEQGDQGSKGRRPGAYDIREDRVTEADAEIRRSWTFEAGHGS